MEIVRPQKRQDGGFLEGEGRGGEAGTFGCGPAGVSRRAKIPKTDAGAAVKTEEHWGVGDHVR